MDRVRRALPAGARLDTWQLDAYSDEPYCQNFRGASSLSTPSCTCTRALHLHPIAQTISHVLRNMLCTEVACERWGLCLGEPTTVDQARSIDGSVQIVTALPAESGTECGFNLIR